MAMRVRVHVAIGVAACLPNDFGERIQSRSTSHFMSSSNDIDKGAQRILSGSCKVPIGGSLPNSTQILRE